MEQQFTYEVLLKLKREKRKKVWKRIVGFMMCMVVFCTTYMLILPAITKETKTYCGVEEHMHEAACYQDVQLCQVHVHDDACFADGDTPVCTVEADPDHSHSEACKDRELICGKEEHTHSKACFSDMTADLENEEIWRETLPELSGNLGKDVIAIAKSQLNYTESSVNYIVDGDDTVKGYTRYGDWYGDPYGDWNAMFVAFCLHYAGIDHPYDTSYSAWVENLKEQDRFKIPSEYVPGAGDVVFFDLEQDGDVDRVGLIDTIENINFTTIEGDSENRVAGHAYDLLDERIVGYGVGIIPISDTDTDEPETDTVTDEPETNTDTDEPETDTDTDEPESDTNTDEPETDTDTDEPEPDTVTDEPETDTDTDESETDTDTDESEPDTVTDEPETDTDTDESEPDTDADEPKPDTDINEEGDPDVIPSGGGGAWAEIVQPAETITGAYEEQPQVYSLRSSAPMRSSTFALRGSSSTYQVTPRAAPLDLTPYINEVNMYDSKGNLIPSGSVVTEGDVIEFKIEYTITGQQLGVLNGETVTVKSDTLTYKLPAIFEMIKNDSGNILNSSGQVVGTYVIDSENETITMTFAEKYVNDNASGMQINGFISFFSTVTKITDTDDEHQDYKFTDKIVLGVTIKEEKEVIGDLEIEKNKVSVSGEDIIYEIKVTSKEGTKGPITITDTMSKGLTFTEGISVKNGSGVNVSADFVASSDKSSFTMTLPEMKAGDSYVVRYKCHADIDLLDADMTVRNTAEVTGKDSDDKELKDEVTVDHNFDMLKKTGKLNDDGTITWTITINQAKADISGWTLEDIVRTVNGNTPYTGPVTIKNSAGNIIANNTGLPYKFPNGSNDTYTVTYTTSHDLGQGQTIYNLAILKDNDTEVNVLSGVNVGYPFKKTGETGEPIQDKDGNNLLPITWTVTIDTTKASIPGGSEFNDTLEGWRYSTADDMYMTYDQLMGAFANIEAAISGITGQKLKDLSAWVYRPGGGVSGKEYDLEDLKNNVDGCQSEKFDRFSVTVNSAGIPKGHMLTFSYETYGVFPNNVVSSSTFANRFNLMGQYEVETSVDYTLATVKATKSAMRYFNPDAPNGSQDWQFEAAEGTSWFDYEKLHDSYLAWAIELSIPPTYLGTEDVVIYENLPDGVSVKALDLNFLSDIPTDRLKLRDMKPGNTYTWDFMLYPADQYGAYRPQGAKEVSITVKVTEDGDLEITVPGIVFETMAKVTVKENQGRPEATKLTEWWGYLYIYTQINDDFEWTPESEGSQVYVDSFKNQFTVIGENGKVIDVGSQTQIIRKDESKGAIRKQANTDSNNIITYSVIINAYGKDLIQNSGILAVTDELTYTSTPDDPLRLRLVPGSVKLYEARLASDGSYTKIKEVPVEYSYMEFDNKKGDVTEWLHTIDMIVPDGKTLLLEYSYKASGEKYATHNVLNSCSVSGVGEGSIDGDHKLEIEVKDATAQADTKGVMLYKVDADSDGVFLENARFNIYIWNEEQNKYIIVHHPDGGGTDFVTDTNGMIVLDTSTMANDQFAYNTAYYIVEVASPEGYYLGPEPYYFYIVNNDTEAYPPCIPDGFVGRALTSGDIIYRKNVNEITKIHVEKYWQDLNGEAMTVTGQKVSSVTLELWQMLEGQPDSAKLYGTYTMTPDEDGNWSLTITGLPKAIRNADGTKGTDYLYYVKEVGVGGYELESSENNTGINSGTITLTNRKVDHYVLPETGGVGTQAYAISGLLLIFISTALLINNHNKSKKEDSASP